MNKSFKGAIQADSSQTIKLSTNNGLTGYKIKKLNVIGQQPSALDQESTFKIFSSKNNTIASTIDFNDPTLLAVAFYETEDTTTLAENANIVFDNMVFNQDIELTMKGTPDRVLNYYLELEQVKLSENEATVATLKDMRAGPSSFAP